MFIRPSVGWSREQHKDGVFASAPDLFGFIAVGRAIVHHSKPAQDRAVFRLPQEDLPMTSSKLTLALAGIGMIFSAGLALAATLPANITTTQTKVGTVYATAGGKTVYEFKKDNPHKQQSACNAGCAKLWPPVAAPAGFVPAAPWGVITRGDGTPQLTYDGYPLYTWSKDAKPGDVTGQGVKDLWRAARPGATPLTWTTAQ
jgi:predicted lipoprotein with Yx(FWY)xxD motif